MTKLIIYEISIIILKTVFQMNYEFITSFIAGVEMARIFSFLKLND